VERNGIGVAWNNMEKLAGKDMSNSVTRRNLRLSLRNCVRTLKGEIQQLKEDIEKILQELCTVHSSEDR
jgi:hypothetical protein